MIALVQASNELENAHCTLDFGLRLQDSSDLVVKLGLRL